MKYLTNYTDQKATKAFDKAGAFFAFSKKQFDEEKKENVNYMNLGSGLICPEENAISLTAEVEAIVKNGIEQDMAENGAKAIIHRELANHEAQISMSITDTVEALEEYPITREDVNAEWKEYFDYCIDNNYF